jgi:putative phosphoribosyl transferase
MSRAAYTGGVRFFDRRDAGQVLAGMLPAYAHAPDAIVLGLARGGVIVAAAIAEVLGLPLDVLVIRKLALPWAPEVAFGALSAAGWIVMRDPTTNVLTSGALNTEALTSEALRSDALVSSDLVSGVIAQQHADATRLDALYRRGRAPLDLTGRTALLVDDGLATGATADAAIATARHLGAERIVFAVPVGAPNTLVDVAASVDDIICPLRPANFVAVSPYYDDFDQTVDEDVVAAMAGLS